MPEIAWKIDNFDGGIVKLLYKTNSNTSLKKGKFMTQSASGRLLRIGFIGGGNMAEAFIGALIRSKTVPAYNIFVSDVNPRRLDLLRRTHRVETTPDNHRVFSATDVTILAVKPQQMPPVLSELAGSRVATPRKKKRIISIAAGFPIRKIEACLYAPLSETGKKRLPVIRVMPNTPAQVLKGVSGMSPNRYATREDIRITRKILSSIGRVLEFPEKDLDAVTALSGSGPAYVFYFIESLCNAGLRLGLKKKDAAILTVETFRGALALLEERGESPEALRREVTSPGGTTEAALGVLEKGRVGHCIVEAVAAAKKRAQELSL